MGDSMRGQLSEDGMGKRAALKVPRSDKSKSLLFCTYCSARKRKYVKSIPAIMRYLSPRIQAVYRMSRKHGGGFAILSGKFGLLGPHRRIPYYDHLLGATEIPAILPQMSGYLKRKGFRAVRFYRDPGRFPQLGPYLKAIKLACRMAHVRLKLVELVPRASRTNQAELKRKREQSA
jgi:hypothetical protein